jgi:hypothetical protein
MADQETMRRLAAIRRLARQMPLKNADERLAKIAEVAAGKGDVAGIFRPDKQSNLAERLEAGLASRAPMPGDPPKPKEEPKKKRKLLVGLDRLERGGRDREE